MLLTKTIKIKTSYQTVEHYKKLGYKFDKCLEEITVSIEDLVPNSHKIVKCACDNCETKRDIIYQHYTKFTKKLTEPYYCKKCHTIKTKKSNLKKYGVENVFQLNSVKEKSKRTNLEKYGTEYASQSEEIKDKIKETCLEKYGEEHFRKTKEYDIKYKITCLEKYGDEYSWQSKEVKDKIKETNLEKYGTEYASQSEEIKDKIKDTHYRKYNNKFYNQTDEYKNMIKETCLEKFGYVNFFEYYYSFNERNSIESLEKSKQTRIKNKLQTPDELLSEWKLYKRSVNNITKRNKKELFEKWNGYDYYDNEFIKNNFSLKYTDKKYPTIDHKISIYNGFLEKIPKEIIGDIQNLCITKLVINSSKRTLNEDEYKKKMDR